MAGIDSDLMGTPNIYSAVMGQINGYPPFILCSSSALFHSLISYSIVLIFFWISKEIGWSILWLDFIITITVWTRYELLMKPPTNINILLYILKKYNKNQQKNILCWYVLCQVAQAGFMGFANPNGPPNWYIINNPGYVSYVFLLFNSFLRSCIPSNWYLGTRIH